MPLSSTINLFAMEVCLRPTAPAVGTFRSLQSTICHGLKLLMYWTSHLVKTYHHLTRPTSLTWVHGQRSRISIHPMTHLQLAILDELACWTKKRFATFCHFPNPFPVLHLGVAHLSAPIFQFSARSQLLFERLSMGFCVLANKVLWPKVPSVDHESKQSLVKDETFLPTSKLESAPACK